MVKKCICDKIQNVWYDQLVIIDITIAANQKRNFIVNDKYTLLLLYTLLLFYCPIFRLRSMQDVYATCFRFFLIFVFIINCFIISSITLMKENYCRYDVIYYAFKLRKNAHVIKHEHKFCVSNFRKCCFNILSKNTE